MTWLSLKGPHAPPRKVQSQQAPCSQQPHTRRYTGQTHNRLVTLMVVPWSRGCNHDGGLDSADTTVDVNQYACVEQRQAMPVTAPANSNHAAATIQDVVVKGA